MSPPYYTCTKPTECEVLVVGTARNCAKHLKNDIFRLQDALTDFKKIYWLVVESDSNDGTLFELEWLASNVSSFCYISLDNLSEKLPSRTERIAFCRNIYMQKIKQTYPYSNVDFVLVADLDGVNKLITREAIRSCFTRNDWDVCTANQNGHYYDIWALRHRVWSPNDCFEQSEFLRSYGLGKRRANFAAIHSKQLVIPPSAPWINVESAFGGLALYRKDAIASGEYAGALKGGVSICEHVILHQQITDKGFKIFINPALINADITEHTYAHYLRERAKAWIKKISKRLCF